MLITLTVMNKRLEWKENIQVNPQQRIEDTIKILIEAGKVSSCILTEHTKIKSIRKSMFVDCRASYEQEGIYTGDTLELL